ncbi:response regulator [Desulfosarcina sp.]|uniref:response regulator n=1 Tax=Desulfosarcina sp. TaxID=2027861 RepID=UPI0029B503D4|nr:response regulator [Desulfosarcina sp.]MDX2451969.1 response regulator [Desulfosarcina sp.]MDX2489753.1 response regulator [Desulfosarcina sp.]
MKNKVTLKGKTILAVDDEPDILESIEEVLENCDVDTANDFNTAKQKLNSKTYDLVVLDIMGVQGYDLLEIAREKNSRVVMLTGHALSPDNFAKSMDGGADAYLPKNKLAELDVFLEDVLGDDRQQPGVLGMWFDRLKGYYEKKFGPGWLDEYKGSWH